MGAADSCISVAVEHVAGLAGLSGKFRMIVLQLFLLHTLECAHATKHLIPVNKITIELRPVNAHKLGLAAYRQAAGTAHPRTVNHNRVEGHIVGDTIFFGHERAELHHDGWTDGQYLVYVLFIEDLFHAHSNDTLFAV